MISSECPCRTLVVSRLKSRFKNRRENLCCLVEHPWRVSAELVTYNGSSRESEVGRFLGLDNDHGHSDRRESKQNEIALVGTADRSGNVEFRATNYRIG